MFRNVAIDGHDVGDPPAPREREQDRREAEQREQVALVDAGRDGEERERQDARRRRGS